MFASLPPAVTVAAPELEPATLEAAFVRASASARAVADPGSVLAGSGPSEAKLDAIDALQSRIPSEPKAKQVADLNALAAAATAAGQPPEVRAKALTFLGYVMPEVQDDAARTRGLQVALAALKDPEYRLFALRGLGPACHELPKADEAAYQGALLDLLDGPVAGEDRETALVAFYSFVSTREDLAKRDPSLVESFDARLLAPVEASPARFVADTRYTPGARSLWISTVWWSAHFQQALGQPAPAARVHALLGSLAAIETDPTVLSWIETYRDAAPARPGSVLRASTTKRAPSGPEEP